MQLIVFKDVTLEGQETINRDISKGATHLYLCAAWGKCTDRGPDPVDFIIQSQNASCAICHREEFWRLGIKLMRFVMNITGRSI